MLNACVLVLVMGFEFELFKGFVLLFSWLVNRHPEYNIYVLSSVLMLVLMPFCFECCFEIKKKWILESAFAPVLIGEKRHTLIVEKAVEV